jgi:Ras-related protein Rab-11A
MPLDRGSKVVFIGSVSVGKTTLMTRMADDRFDPNTEPTTCAAYAQYKPPDNNEVLIQFWDTAGMERYKSINKMYYQDAVVALLVFDLGDRKTFLELNDWKEGFERENHTAAVILVGNKCDLQERQHVSEEDARAWAQEAAVEYFAVSALTGEGVGELLDGLVRAVPRKGLPVLPRQPVARASREGKQCC